MKRYPLSKRFKKAKAPLLVVMLCCTTILLSGCAQKRINPLTLPILKSDSIETRFPPSTDELILRPYILLPLITYKDQTVTESRLNDILHFIHSSLEENGNFSVMTREQTSQLLAKEENRHFQPRNIADAIQLGVSINVDFVSQMQITIIESKMVKNIDHIKANVNLTLFTTGSGQVIIKHNALYDSQNLERSDEALRRLVQTNFPIRGFILETRGGHQVAKISLGRSAGIKLGRQILIRERQVNSQIVNGVSRKTITFNATALAKTEVIQVLENESWLAVNKGDQHKIKKGQVIFTLPE
jgi:hypothetical protein